MGFPRRHVRELSDCADPFGISSESRAATPSARAYDMRSSSKLLANAPTQQGYAKIGQRESDVSRDPPNRFATSPYSRDNPRYETLQFESQREQSNGRLSTFGHFGSVANRNEGRTDNHLRYEGVISESAFCDMNHPSHGDHDRRTSQGSGGSSLFHTGSQDISSQPAAFGNRQMPPPSPPQHYLSRGQSGNHAHGPPSSILSRDPFSSSSHRPGSSMSISSMLGSDADRPTREPGSLLFSRSSASAPFSSAPPPSVPGAMSPPTAPVRPSSLDYPLFRPSETPDKSFSKNQLMGSYRSSSGDIQQGSVAEPTRFGSLSRTPTSFHYPEKETTQPSSQAPSIDASFNKARRSSFSDSISRPGSQPQAIEPVTRPAYSPLSRAAQAPGEGLLSTSKRPSSYMGLGAQHTRYNGLFSERQAEDQAHRDRDRLLSNEPDMKPSRFQSRYGLHYGERGASDRQPTSTAWEPGRPQPPSPETKRFPSAESTAGFGFGAIQSYTKSLGSQLGGSRLTPLSIQHRQGQPSPPPNEPSYSSKLSTSHRLMSTTPNPLPGRLTDIEDQRRKGSDELTQHRSLLGMGVDARIGERASPLPQAVQGAQAQIIGPGAESGIKNELGRVFSGIGSGVGGVTLPSGGSGPSTPMTASPFKRDSVTARSVGNEATETHTIARPLSTSGNRPRKSGDEENHMETEASFDRQADPAGRGARRGRHLHHHHHHHHHYLHKNEEESALAVGRHRPASSNALNRTSTPAEGAGTNTVIPHHHHHHHHHHHPSRLTASAAAAPFTSPSRELQIIVKIESLLESVAHLARHHLGSTLYAHRIGVPTAKATLESSKFGYTTTPLPIPRFDGKENCTFTVRVPRFRIDSSHREEICARRALWGTGVYTDDSDPVAAAIHSGFIRGAWGEEVDESLLDLEILDSYQHAPQPNEAIHESNEKSNEEARLPPIPPPDKDLHITLLILPKLERYESSALFGLKSRAWDSSHDGMSFKVLRIDWVDEGVGRGEERSGEARRKRLRYLMQNGLICTGPALIKLDQLQVSGVSMPRLKIDIGAQDRALPVSTVS